MNLKIKLLVLLAGIALSVNAAVPTAEQLLSADTLAVLNVPDWSKAKTAYNQMPAGQLSQDPAIKAFKDKFLDKFKADILTPLEKELGVKLADYADLMQGQVTLGLNLKAAEGLGDPTGSWCLLIDSRNKSDLLKQCLGDLKKKWTEGGKQLKTDKIRDLDFTTLSISQGDLQKSLANAFPQFKGKSDSSDSDSGDKMTLTFGQSESLLLIGNNSKDLERILARQAGGQASALAEQPEFQANQPLFRESLVFGWVNLKPLISLLSKKVSAMAAAAAKANPMTPKPDKVISAIGIDALQTLAFSVQNQSAGNLVNFVLNVPEGGRKGLIKAFLPEPKNANPPAFVPADVAKFNRYRLDSQKTWSTVEAMVAEISPELNGMLQMLLGAAGKAQDPNFDLKKSLIGNLGDDFITYQSNPKKFTMEALNSPPALMLLGSPNADQLVAALKTAAVAANMVPPSSIKEREFLGRKIYSVALPSMKGDDDDKAGDRNLNFVSSGGYLAISTDDAILEGYLRSAEQKPKALDANAAVKDAAQKVDGMSTGLFGYENQSETMRTVVETLKQDSGAFEKLFAMRPGRQAPTSEEKEKLKAWFDFSLLPPYEKIAKYFYFTVYSYSATSSGIGLKVFSPMPPGLAK